MVFSSLLFLFWFLPIFFIIYYAVNAKFKNAVLLIGSIAFYAWGEPKYLILIFVSILVNYFAGLLMQSVQKKLVDFKSAKYSRSESNRIKKYVVAKKIILIAALFYDFAMLMVFKYTNFFVENINVLFKTDFSEVDITLPLGISFYTFQIASYVIDLYRNYKMADDCENIDDTTKVIGCERNIINLATYLCMFPQLIAGPIVVYSDVSERLKNRHITLSDVEEGIRIFILGLGSKVLIANNVGALFTRAEELSFENISMPLAWLSMISYTLQIFFDFNGYSLMAIGLGRMLGFTFPKNFDYPYISRSLTEFWRRWHITLSTWFREYVYIPLGGNRKGKIRNYVNLFIVWFLTGFWHGASWNFIFWGLFFFVILSIEKLFIKDYLDKHKIFSHVYSLLLIAMSWMIFAITDLAQIRVFFSRLFCFEFADDFIYYFRNYAVIMIIGCILSTPVFSRVYEKYKKSLAGVIFSILVLVLSVAYLADATFNPFLYFRF